MNTGVSFKLSMHTMKFASAILLINILPLLSACAKDPYVYHQSPPPEQPEPISTVAQSSLIPPQIERGEPYPFLDYTASWTIGIISKIILWNINMDNHYISSQTEEALKEYLSKNNLSDVKVRLNQYAPVEEWQRLWDNDSMGILWRATLGVISNLGYTILPGRFFGGDSYNPYTNTISIYSDHPAVALHEGGHSKDFAEHEWKGFYSFIYILPLVSLHHEWQATSDAMGYIQDNQCLKEQARGYKVLYPAYATYIGGNAVSLLAPGSPVGSVIGLAAVIPAHIVGRIKAANVEEENDQCVVIPNAEEKEPAEQKTEN